MRGKRQQPGYFSISVVAKTYDIHPQTLRTWEREGLLTPSRSEGNTRLYAQEDVERLEAILNLTREFGVNLAGVDLILKLREQMDKMQQDVNELLRAFRQVMIETLDDGETRYKSSLVRVSPKTKVIRLEDELEEKIVSTEDQGMSAENLNWYLKEIAKIPRLTPEDEKTLGEAIQGGDEGALNRLVESNLRFVVSICKKYRGLGLSFLDLMNEGNIGLIEAAKRFDPEKNVKFITYAVWWIRQAIIHALSKNTGAFRLPQKQANLMYQLGKKYNVLTQKLEREPTVAELAEALNVTVEEVEQILQVSGENISLSGAMDDDNDFQLLDKLVQDTETDADDALMQDAFETQVKKIIRELDEKESIIIKLRFGLEGSEPKTLKEIGQVLNLSRERIRQIENVALRKLRKNNAIQNLRGFLS